MNHSQTRDLLPGYALGSLELLEREELEQHLQSCSACYQVAREHVEVAGMLASGITEAEPPPGLKSRIQDSVAQESKPIEYRATRDDRSFFARLGLTGSMPVFAGSAAVLAVVGLMVAVLVYSVVSQSDLSSLQDENVALSAKLNEQLALVSASQTTLDQQNVTLSSSQSDLQDLRQANQGLSVKLDDQTAAIILAQASLANVQAVSDSLPTTLGTQSDALAATQQTLGDQSTALASTQQTLADLRQENQEQADRVEAQRAALAAAQTDLDQLGQDNVTLLDRISGQDDILAASQSNIDSLSAENAAVAATTINQQIFTYLQALPVTNKFVLKATGAAPGTFGLLMTNVANSWGVAAVLGVEPLGPDNWYQLWLEKDGVATHGWFIKQVDPATKFGQV